MASRLFDHIDLRVRDLAEARPFYDAFLPAVGLGKIRAGDDWAGYSATGVEDHRHAPFVWLNVEPNHRGGANRIAFWADGEEEVNRIAGIVRAAGACAVEGPEYCHDYTPGYYAVFFEDVCGNKWEVCFRDARVRPS